MAFASFATRCNKYLSLVKNDDVMDLIVVFCILFVFTLVLYCFCVATEFSVNKDLYIITPAPSLSGWEPSSVRRSTKTRSPHDWHWQMMIAASSVPECLRVTARPRYLPSHTHLSSRFTTRPSGRPLRRSRCILECRANINLTASLSHCHTQQLTVFSTFLVFFCFYTF